ncbi:hypothetical protein ROS9278_02618 [Roseomonas sp. CECT 9278]|nr:hypothetical protein ROS9278_02618 [Roseomonas sp. CECT 9278]
MTTRSIPASLASRNRATLGEGWLFAIDRMLRAIESRRRLAEMDGRMLSDIGISRAEALVEAARAPWDLTERRR